MQPLRTSQRLNNSRPNRSSSLVLQLGNRFYKHPHFMHLNSISTWIIFSMNVWNPQYINLNSISTRVICCFQSALEQQKRQSKNKSFSFSKRHIPNSFNWFTRVTVLRISASLCHRKTTKGTKLYKKQNPKLTTNFQIKQQPHSVRVFIQNFARFNQFFQFIVI